MPYARHRVGFTVPAYSPGEHGIVRFRESPTAIKRSNTSSNRSKSCLAYEAHTPALLRRHLAALMTRPALWRAFAGELSVFLALLPADKGWPMRASRSDLFRRGAAVPSSKYP